MNESKIAREFGISRIPVREALMQLQEHGLVMNHERRGMFVTRLGEDDVLGHRVLASDEAGLMTGGNVVSDGGMSL